jgi:hypothetical protein
MSTISKRMHKLSIFKLIIGTKVKRFVLVPKQIFSKADMQIVFVFAQKFGDKAKQFDLVRKLSQANRNVSI